MMARQVNIQQRLCFLKWEYFFLPQATVNLITQKHAWEFKNSFQVNPDYTNSNSIAKNGFLYHPQRAHQLMEKSLSASHGRELWKFQYKISVQIFTLLY